MSHKQQKRHQEYYLIPKENDEYMEMKDYLYKYRNVWGNKQQLEQIQMYAKITKLNSLTHLANEDEKDYAKIIDPDDEKSIYVNYIFNMYPICI